MSDVISLVLNEMSDGLKKLFRSCLLGILAEELVLIKQG